MREPGFYWVMNEGRLEVWEWDGRVWFQPGYSGDWEDDGKFPEVVSGRIPEPTQPSAER